MSNTQGKKEPLHGIKKKMILKQDSLSENLPEANRVWKFERNESEMRSLICETRYIDVVKINE